MPDESFSEGHDVGSVVSGDGVRGLPPGVRSRGCDVVKRRRPWRRRLRRCRAVAGSRDTAQAELHLIGSDIVCVDVSRWRRSSGHPGRQVAAKAFFQTSHIGTVEVVQAASQP